MFNPLLALFAFCSEAVPTYSTRSQNAKFSLLSQSLLSITIILFIRRIVISPALNFFNKLF